MIDPDVFGNAEEIQIPDPASLDEVVAGRLEGQDWIDIGRFFGFVLLNLSARNPSNVRNCNSRGILFVIEGMQTVLTDFLKESEEET